MRRQKGLSLRTKSLLSREDYSACQTFSCCMVVAKEQYGVENHRIGVQMCPTIWGLT